jgi:hypothetical protein
MPDAVLTVLEGQELRFLPRDVVLQYNQLFSWHPDAPDAPMEQYGEGWDEWLFEKRSQATRAVYSQGGVNDVRRLAEMAELPRSVGHALAQMDLPEPELRELLRSGLATSPDNVAQDRFAQAVGAFISARFDKEGEEWLQRVLTIREMSWTANMYANLALALPASPSIWERVERWGDEVDMKYWRNVGIPGNFRRHWPEILEKWRKVDRPWSSLELVARLVDERHEKEEMPKPSAEVVADVLGWALRSGKSGEQLRNYGNMLSYYVEHMFLFLDAQNAEPKQVAQLEWGWLRGNRSQPGGIFSVN